MLNINRSKWSSSKRAVEELMALEQECRDHNEARYWGVDSEEEETFVAFEKKAEEKKSEVIHLVTESQEFQVQYAQDKNGIYAFLICLKRIFGMNYPHVRNCFKSILLLFLKNQRHVIASQIIGTFEDEIRKKRDIARKASLLSIKLTGRW